MNIICHMCKVDGPFIQSLRVSVHKRHTQALGAFILRFSQMHSKERERVEQVCESGGPPPPPHRSHTLAPPSLSLLNAFG